MADHNDAIVLPVALRQDIIHHARETLPNECCGYITGVDAVCKTVYRMTNVDASPEHFSFDPAEQFKVIKTARRQGETPLVVYHSHPETPARLSDEDLRLLTDPHTIYVIVSMATDDPDVKAYRISDGVPSHVIIYDDHSTILNQGGN